MKSNFYKNFLQQDSFDIYCSIYVGALPTFHDSPVGVSIWMLMISISAITLGFALIFRLIYQLEQPVVTLLLSILDGNYSICYYIVGTCNLVNTSVKRSFIIVLFSNV